MDPSTDHIYLKLFLPVASCFLLLSTALSAAEQSRIVYPPDKAIVTTPRLRVVGTAAPGASRLLLRLKSGAAGDVTATMAANGFSAVVALAPGLNAIALLGPAGETLDSREVFLRAGGNAPDAPADFAMYYLHSKGDLAATCESCHVPGGAYLEQIVSCQTDECHPRFGKARFVHGPVAGGFCIGCHNPHGSPHAYFHTNTQFTVCYSCHEMAGEYINQKYQHFPVQNGECTSCHDPHESNLEFHLKRGSLAELCAGCHRRKESTYSVLHEPVAKGDCVACHDPHASNHKALLYEDKTSLCFVCHKVREEEFQRKHVHEPVARDCGLCHDPHGSSTKYHLRTARDGEGRYTTSDPTLKDTCLECHRQLDPEEVERINHSTVKHEPVVAGKCTVCHTPHSTNYRKQLKAPLREICFNCHKKMKRTIEQSRFRHGPVKNNDCSHCHVAHGGEYANLLVADFTSEFSAEFDAEQYRLCFNCHVSKVYTAPKSSETGFRNGDNNLHFRHVNEKKKTCKTCHEIHASDNDFHLRAKIPRGRRYAISMNFTRTDTGGGCVVGCHKEKRYDRENPVVNQ